MEKLRIGKGTTEYPYESIVPISPTVLQIVFAGTIPPKFGDITLVTAGGLDITTLGGYDTVYRDEGQTIYLSNDGSVYEPPQEPDGELPPDPYVPTPEELLLSARASKKAEMSRECEQIHLRR